jgi:transglutaminase-like putative cysteine protease
MAELSRRGSQCLPVREKAKELTRGLLQKDFEGEARAIFYYCRDQIRYVRDIRGVETLHDPVTMLQTKQGDCDDKAILAAALLGSIGHECRFVAVSFHPGQFCHVWIQVNVRGKWLDMETTEPLPFGQRIPTRGQLKLIYMDI